MLNFHNQTSTSSAISAEFLPYVQFYAARAAMLYPNPSKCIEEHVCGLSFKKNPKQTTNQTKKMKLTKIHSPHKFLGKKLVVTLTVTSVL